MAASQRNISESFRSIEERKLFLGIRGRDVMFLGMVDTALFLIFWPTIGTFYGAIAITFVDVCAIIALVSLYKHSLYWLEYTFGKDAYKNDTWVA